MRDYHGYSKTPTYRTWCAMIRRCEVPKATDYKHYGGRGIKVCERWRSSFSDFLTDVGERPEGMSLDRINSDGDYEPGNVQWATQTTQVIKQRHMPSASGYRGVYTHKGRWESSIKIDGQPFYIGGNANDPDYLAALYDQWAIELHGEHAQLNFAYQ